jgi:hypothetical protein
MDVAEGQDLITLDPSSWANAYFPAGFGGGESAVSIRFHSPA